MDPRVETISKSVMGRHGIVDFTDAPPQDNRNDLAIALRSSTEPLSQDGNLQYQAKVSSEFRT